MVKYDKNNPNHDFYIHDLKNIVKTDKGYKLQNVYAIENNCIVETKENKNNPTNKSDHNCYVCIYHDSCNNCLMRTKLENLHKNHCIPIHCQNKCDAYTPISALNIISSKDEMVNFIEKAENFFDCPENYENYFGFNRNWDEETGEILETTREYYNRGGMFKNIPDKYPSVIYFPYGDISNDSYRATDFKWIYIGDELYTKK